VLNFTCVISGFHRDVDDICSLLGYYTAQSGNSVLTFQDNLSIPSSRVKKSNLDFLGPIGCPETSVQNYHSMCNNQKSAELINFTFFH
jgi:hypothetical protein